MRLSVLMQWGMLKKTRHTAKSLLQERQSATSTCPCLCAQAQTLYLEDEGRAGLQLQHPCGAEWLKDRVWVVDEIGGVDDQQGLDVIHDKADLIRAVAKLRRAPLGVVNGGSVAHHGGVVVDGAVLQEARNEVRPTPNKVGRIRPHKDS